MSQAFFIGIDAGGSKCRGVLFDQEQRLIAKAMSGPANIALSVTDAWANVQACIASLLAQQATLKPAQVYVGIGIAGCENVQAYQQFTRFTHDFAALKVISDAHTACLGAHNGADGAIIIIGTGSVAYQISASTIYKVGGWGFPFDDGGSGAWIGWQASKLVLQKLDGRLAKSSSLIEAILAHTAEYDFMNWLYHANATKFAQLAPFVIQAADAGEADAKHIMQQAAVEIDQLALGLVQQSHLAVPLALVGGVAPFLKPYLSHDLQARIIPCQKTPEEGAVIYVQQAFANV